MPIIYFDTVEEFRAFMKTPGASVGRRPKAALTTLKKAAKKSTSTAVKKTDARKTTEKKGKPGRKPAAATQKAAAPKKAVKAAAVKKAAAPKKPRTPKSDTLTAKIKSTIQQFLNSNKAFTANDIYDSMSKQHKGINKQSVITSVLKQINTSFSNVKVTERPGAGPRPVKLYNPA